MRLWSVIASAVCVSSLLCLCNGKKMSTTISQSVLMALTVTVNQYASSNVYAVNHRNRKVVASATSSTAGRRGILLSAVLAAYSVNDSKTELLQKYLKKSKENKAKNDKERVDSYYKRNYKDYFEFVEGSLRGKSENELTESEKGILDWLKKNK